MPLQPYRGTSRKLLLGIDIGTTFSGVSYCVLDPGEVPKVLSVTRFPGQEDENRLRDTKIPTIAYYDKDGRVREVGAEARTESARLEASDNNWVLTEWFKLCLRPADMADGGQTEMPTLPLNKSVVEVFADFMAYIYKCATDYISESDPKGRKVLRPENDIEFVLTHPNGWSGNQQNKMRQAAVRAGLIPETEAGQSRIHFVTEGEASLHYCINNGLVGDEIKTGNRLMIVDAGGGTVDLSTYEIQGVTPVSVAECTPADCLLQGSIFVNARARELLREKLKTSPFGNEEDLFTMLDSFEVSIKPAFKDAAKTSYLKFGSYRDNDENNDIKRGVLSLSGPEMASFFRPSVSAIEGAITEQADRAGAPIDMILLVGGFSSSPFLRSELRTFLQRTGMMLFSLESQPAKAVAEGALSCYLNRALITSRVARFAYGTVCNRAYRKSDPEHVRRYSNSDLNAAGHRRIHDAFFSLIRKGTSVSSDEEFAKDFVQHRRDSFSDVWMKVYLYKGNLEHPQWVDEDPSCFVLLCTVHADISRVPKIPRYGSQGLYHSQDYKLVLLFGLIELKAQLSWMENGNEMRGPATIVYDDYSE